MWNCTDSVWALILRFFSSQVHGSHFRLPKDPCHTITGSTSAPATITRASASHRNRRHHHHRVTSHLRAHQNPPTPTTPACEGLQEKEQWADQQHPDAWRTQWRSSRSSSLFSLPNLGSASSRSTCSSPGPSPSPHHRNHSLHRSNSFIPSFRLNVDALIGAEETDVDTGDKVNPGSSVDLSVVSAYISSSVLQTSRPLSAPPEDIGHPLSPGVPAESYKAATLGRTPHSFSANISSSLSGFQSVNDSVAPSLSDISVHQSDSGSFISATIVEADKLDEEDDQEFYIWSLDKRRSHSALLHLQGVWNQAPAGKQQKFHVSVFRIRFCKSQVNKNANTHLKEII